MRLPAVTAFDQNLVAKKITKSYLQQAYTLTHERSFDFTVQTIQAILQDHDSICLRDLPAYYASAASLLYKLKGFDW